MKLSLETRNYGDVIIVQCQGRIVYRDEAASLSHLVGEILDQNSRIVLDLSGVTKIDSAGIGKLVLLQNRAQDKNVSLKCASPNPVVRRLLDLTNVDSVLDVHSSLDSALQSFREEHAWADC